MSDEKKHSVELAAESKEEADLQESLARVNDAYHQLTETRRTIHRMLQPLHAPAADPELVYTAFTQSAQHAVEDLKRFQNAIRDPKMQELLKKSRDTMKDLGGANDVKDWLGGLNDDWAVNEVAGAAVDGLDALKMTETPKKT